MSTLRETCANDEDEKIAPVAILKLTVNGLLIEAAEMSADLHRLAVRQHYFMQKVSICLHNLERHCELH